MRYLRLAAGLLLLLRSLPATVISGQIINLTGQIQSLAELLYLRTGLQYLDGHSSFQRPIGVHELFRLHDSGT